jgi:hypothetical protein
MFMIDYKEFSWWYWLAIVVLLTAGVAGYPAGFASAVGLGAIQLLHFALIERSTAAFSVQVRFFYWLFLLAIMALPEPARTLVYWLPTLGTWATVLFGFCGMARMVSLLPWNRREPFSLDLVKRTMLARPTRHNMLHGLPPAR